MTVGDVLKLGNKDFSGYIILAGEVSMKSRPCCGV